MDNLMVLCVDRDNDLGKKAGVKGPVVGRKSNLEAASKLALADPTESDANAIFAAVKKFDELSKILKRVEVVTLTGHGKGGFQSDRIINEQLDEVVKKFKPSGFVLVTDGAEDDQIIPILQSRAKIVSKETVIIKQAQQIESAFFTVKEALKDPYFAKIFFGIPGVAVLLLAIFGLTGLQIVMFVFGIVLLMFGLSLMDPILEAIRSVTGSISVQRMSFPFYIGSIGIAAFGVYTAYTTFLTIEITNLILDSLKIAQTTYMLFAMGALGMVIGRIIDVFHFKKAFLLRKYLMTGVSIVLGWWILDTATLVLLREVGLDQFLTTILGSFLILLISFRLSEVLDIRERITKLLVGLPIYSAEGAWIGKVKSIDRRRKSITFVNEEDKSVEINKKKFSLRKGKIMLSS